MELDSYWSKKLEIAGDRRLQWIYMEMPNWREIGIFWGFFWARFEEKIEDIHLRKGSEEQYRGNKLMQEETNREPELRGTNMRQLSSVSVDSASTRKFAKRTRAQMLEQARRIPLPLSESSSSEEETEEIFEMANRTLKQLAVPTFDPNLLCILDGGTECEIKPGLIRALPIFSGFRNTSSLGSVYINEANRFLKEFHIACSGMKPAGVTLDQLKLKTFPFALTDAAKEWLFGLPAGTITT